MFLRSTFFFMGLGPKFLDTGSQPFLSGSPRNMYTSLVWGQALKASFDFFATLKIGGENLKFRRPAVNRKRVTLKRLNLSTNKKMYISSTINALKRYGTWGITPRGSDITCGKFDKL